MITDYQLIPVEHPIIDSVILWDHRVWLNLKQLQTLFHVNKTKMERMIVKLSDTMMVYSHYETFSILRKKKHGDKEFDYIYQIRHYDEFVIQALRKQYQNAEAACLIAVMEQIKAEARP